MAKLHEDTNNTIRLVYSGDYDICVCIGSHRNNTYEIGQVKIISSNYEDVKLRIRFKLNNPSTIY